MECDSEDNEYSFYDVALRNGAECRLKSSDAFLADNNIFDNISRY
jgi:hypothetical protein